jgi:methylated-DNA-[protein]-cysteine S-methyltransferase
VVVADGEALTGLWFLAEHRWFDGIDDRWRRDPVPLAGVTEQLAAYFAGELRRFDVPLAPDGTAFQRRVWQALTAIPYGTTTSYGALAQGLGRPGSARAVGAANGRNPISVVVPCHRVVGATGDLVGYGGGLETKRRLLALESGQRSLMA